MSGEEGRQLDVLLGRELVQEVEGLEDEADLGAPQARQRPLGIPVDPLSGQPQLPGPWPVEPAEQVQQRRLPAAARPRHREHLTACYVQADTVHGADQSLAAAVLLAQPAGAQRPGAVCVVHRRSFRPARSPLPAGVQNGR